MKTILVIEDYDVMRDLLVDLFRQEQFDVTTAHNGERGLRLLQERRFDLVVTDIVMPDREGIEVITTARKQDPDLPIIAISGGMRLSATVYLSMARRLGATYTFEKPIDRHAFMEAVRNCLVG